MSNYVCCEIDLSRVFFPHYISLKNALMFFYFRRFKSTL